MPLQYHCFSMMRSLHAIQPVHVPFVCPFRFQIVRVRHVDKLIGMFNFLIYHSNDFQNIIHVDNDIIYLCSSRCFIHEKLSRSHVGIEHMRTQAHMWWIMHDGKKVAHMRWHHAHIQPADDVIKTVFNRFAVSWAWNHARRGTHWKHYLIMMTIIPWRVRRKMLSCTCVHCEQGMDDHSWMLDNMNKNLPCWRTHGEWFDSEHGLHAQALNIHGGQSVHMMSASQVEQSFHVA